MSRNAEYEKRQKEKGLVKTTVWVTREALPELKIMADYCKENPNCVPFMVRDLNTGKMKRPK